MKIFVSILLFSLVIISCKNTKETGTTDTPVKKGLLVDDFRNYENSANYSIENIALNQNILTINLNYSGGCEAHEFTLIGLKAIGKTLPPKRSIMLFHQGNNDSCRELISEELQFDINDFGYRKGEEIILELANWPTPINYTLQ